ncbi:MAG TPA: hypothetical protein VFV99_25520 [Kofleriaceae bacterium]|nr:hypothetical protein [Kofleriaceae bacterium]
MRQRLALAVLMVIAGHAEAKRITCSCGNEIALPEWGAQDLPINTKVMRILENGAYLYQLRPELTANVLYADEATGVSFTPNDKRDDAPPEAPHDVNAYVATGLVKNQQTLSLFGNYAPDTAVIHVELRQADRFVTLYTTPNRLYLCRSGMDLGPGTVDVRITAIDIAGNESAPFATSVKPSPIDDVEDHCRDSGFYEHHHHDHGFEILFLLLLYPLCVVAWFLIVIVRRATVKRTPAEPVAHLEAAEVVRRLLRWQIVWAVMTIAGVLGLVHARSELPIFLAPFPIVAVAKLYWIRRAQVLLDQPETDAVRHGRWLCVTSLRDTVTVRASDIDFVWAKRAGIPKSVAK